MPQVEKPALAKQATILDTGRKLLAELAPASGETGTWKAFFSAYRFNAAYPDDAYIWLSGILALTSVTRGNFGVGSILIDDAGDVVAQGHNEVFRPYFRSDRHAEMVVMTRFEADPHPTDLSSHTLYTSLEPCPMCLVRLSTSGIAKVLYAAADAEGGMVHRQQGLPPFWNDLARRKVFAQAHCSPDLIGAAERLFFINLDELMEKIKQL
jgi:cytosine deaminase